MAFFLQRISIRIGRTVNFYFSSLDLHILAFSLRLHQRTVYTDTRTCCYRLQKFFAQLVHVYNDLNIIYCRTVIQGYETNLFTTTAGTDPSFTLTVVPKASLFSTSTIFVLLIASMFIFLFLGNQNKLAGFSNRLNSILFESPHAERVHFTFVQITPLSTSKVLFCKTGKIYTIQFNHVIAQ